MATDHALQRQVAIKEYLPAVLSSRGRGTGVTLRSDAHAETFAAGLESFVNEARLLARFDHPALMRVYRFWEANHTAYMVMPYYEGVTLDIARRAMARPPDEAWLRGLLLPLLGALDVLHGYRRLHLCRQPRSIGDFVPRASAEPPEGPAGHSRRRDAGDRCCRSHSSARGRPGAVALQAFRGVTGRAWLTAVDHNFEHNFEHRPFG